MKRSGFKPTLTQTFVFAFLGLALLLLVLFAIFIRGSGHSILESSERVRNEASREIVGRVSDYLHQATRVSDSLEESMSRGVIDQENPRSLEAGLYSVLISNKDIQEVTLTFGVATGFDEDGQIILLPGGRGQVTVFRTIDGSLNTRRIFKKGETFVSVLRARKGDSGFQATEFAPENLRDVTDPTEHPTFTTPANRDFVGKILWSDLHFSPLEEALPESKRHARVSVQKALYNSKQKFIGVLRVALSADQIDQIANIKIAENSQDPHRIFLCDNKGRLITRFSSSDTFADSAGDLRVSSKSLPPEVEMALREPVLSEVDTSNPLRGSRFKLNGMTYLTTFRSLGETQDWIVGIVVPEGYYLGSLESIRKETAWAAVIVMSLILIGGVFLLRGVLSAQSQVLRETTKMNGFDFTPAGVSSPFSDINDSLESLEKAKSAMRALGKYAPIDLVKKLYQEKREPRLGGEMTLVSMMFTDIADFTTISEHLAPNILAESLGRYLEKMVGVIQNQMEGIIDKFIGDAIMAIWNAPTPIKQDAVWACRAALSCQKAAEKLFSSEEWKGLPRFETRIGLHRDTVLVGHFGAPERMNFTALGDGVNLAARLEGLNKAYGTQIIASQTIRDEAVEEFEFRLLDLVAVKGKSKGVAVYELMGSAGSVSENQRKVAAIYEEAFDLYLARKFQEAMTLLEGIPSDPPGQVLLDRCKLYLVNPPDKNWVGVYAATQK